MDVVIVPSAFGIATTACRGLLALPTLVLGRRQVGIELGLSMNLSFIRPAGTGIVF